MSLKKFKDFICTLSELGSVLGLVKEFFKFGGKIVDHDTAIIERDTAMVNYKTAIAKLAKSSIERDKVEIDLAKSVVDRAAARENVGHTATATTKVQETCGTNMGSFNKNADLRSLETDSEETDAD